MCVCTRALLCVPKDAVFVVFVVLSLCYVAAVLRNASVSPLRLFNIRAGCQNYPPSHCKCACVCVYIPFCVNYTFVCVCVLHLTPEIVYLIISIIFFCNCIVTIWRKQTIRCKISCSFKFLMFVCNLIGSLCCCRK